MTLAAGDGLEGAGDGLEGAGDAVMLTHLHSSAALAGAGNRAAVAALAAALMRALRAGYRFQSQFSQHVLCTSSKKSSFFWG